MTTFMAFLHHAAAFALVAAIAVEFALLKGELTAATMRRIVRADMIVGLSAGVVLLVGLGRVFSFEKGAAYYFQLAVHRQAVAVRADRAAVDLPDGELHQVGEGAEAGPGAERRRGPLRALRMLVHAELAGIVLILLFAAMMARGVGFFG